MSAVRETDDQPIRVGIVVAAFNAEVFLAETLASIESQTVDDWRCVVVDDGSADGTAAVAASFAARDDRFRVVQQANAGVSSARNAGIAELTDSRWLAFLDSDDVWLPDALQRLLDTATSRPAAVAVYGLAEYVDEQSRPIRAGQHPTVQRDRRRLGRIDLVGVPTKADSTFETLVVSGTIWPSGVGIYRRDAVTGVGGFDPGLRSVEDWDLMIRLSRRGPLVPTETQVVWYRQHPQGLTRDEAAMAYGYAQARFKTWQSPDNTAQQRRYVRRVWRRLHARWVLWTAATAARALREGDQPAARDAALATAVFAVELLAGRPGRPSRRSAEYAARFVAARRATRQPALEPDGQDLPAASR